ncbi:aldehyde dehydrogenase (NADP(+)) [Anditalea andensis]|uniref:Aldehyde dehydrogenase n=1 Tax=Anditalea andensis TaxID=1048983 RepID=A0A074KSL1_9BACT|nr:aldehyde dehydrogenase (NADP(+)) [Anditalea andensis]KEO71904.1 aldehyde dehydrogenase [Anditalea andensis]
MSKYSISTMVEWSDKAFERYGQSTIATRSKFLLSIIESLTDKKEIIIEVAVQETHLPAVRLQNEFGRTVNQIKLFATSILNGTYLEATIDPGDPHRQPFPKPDIRRLLIPIGPVVVFGASNFPLAFSTIGGDAVSALAAGCTVIYKSHPAHPQTSKLVFEAISEALKKNGLPLDTFIHLELSNEESQSLIMHPLVEAIGFTGSYTAGKLIYDLVQKRDKPIPVFAEMGSVNPIMVLVQKIREDMEELASSYASSLCLGVGQFCTNPGLIFIPETEKETFVALLREKLSAVTPQPMLTSQIAKDYHRKLSEFGKLDFGNGISEVSIDALPAIKVVDSDTWINTPLYHQEVFGPFGMVVTYNSTDDLADITKHLEGQLTITLWATEEELVQHKGIIHSLLRKCGRLLFKGVPTGVEVGHAMQHGGPFPATTDSRSTSVGTFAIKRFLKPIAFQDCPEALLPEELKDDNPLKVVRMVDGEMNL